MISSDRCMTALRMKNPSMNVGKSYTAVHNWKDERCVDCSFSRSDTKLNNGDSYSFQFIKTFTDDNME